MTSIHAAFPAGGPSAGAIGTLVGINSPALTEMLSALGFDFLFLDLEHGGIGDADLLNHVYASRIAQLARLRDGSETSIKRAADSGVAGIVVPHVRSGAMAEQIVVWAAYPPVGERSVGLAPNTLLGAELGAALAEPERPVVIAQIEDVDGVREIEEICRVPRLGGVFIGPFDLSASLGAVGDFAAEAFRAAIGRVVGAAHQANLRVGVFAPTAAAWRDFRAQGCDYAVLGADSLFLADGARRALGEANAMAKEYQTR
ncbi:aldolase/citrate lyase family protein [Rugosimonospora acidiphila]|uniref:Aldolase/citrate lyase family protein n=1 Tax=Rugosimonospora acidiphila TaxID=556531 RepID=A0ABP9RTV7_9ACTN